MCGFLLNLILPEVQWDDHEAQSQQNEYTQMYPGVHGQMQIVAVVCTYIEYFRKNPKSSFHFLVLSQILPSSLLLLIR